MYWIFKVGGWWLKVPVCWDDELTSSATNLSNFQWIGNCVFIILHLDIPSERLEQRRKSCKQVWEVRYCRSRSISQGAAGLSVASPRLHRDLHRLSQEGGIPVSSLPLHSARPGRNCQTIKKILIIGEKVFRQWTINSGGRQLLGNISPCFIVHCSWYDINTILEIQTKTVSLQVSHGAGSTLEGSHNNAALTALRTLANNGLDCVQENWSGNISILTSQFSYSKYSLFVWLITFRMKTFSFSDHWRFKKFHQISPRKKHQIFFC